MVDYMRETIEKIESKFLEIQEIMGDEFEVSNLEDSRYLEKLGSKIDETYIALNTGICEDLDVCHTCTQHRDILGEVMRTLNDLDSGANITEDVILEIKEFSTTVDDVLVRIKGILAQM